MILNPFCGHVPVASLLLLLLLLSGFMISSGAGMSITCSHFPPFFS